MFWTIIGKDDFNEVPGGANRYAFGLVRALKDADVTTRFLVAGVSSSDIVDESIAGNVARRAWGFVKSGLRKGVTPDVINIHFALYGAPFLAGVIVRRFIGLSGPSRSTDMPKVIFNYQGPWSEESRVASGKNGVAIKVKRMLERFCLTRSDRIVVLSGGFAQDVQTRFGVAPERVFEIAPAVENEWFSTSTEDDLDPLDSSGPIDLVCVRRLTQRMGHIRLLDALQSLNFVVLGREVKLHIVGRGQEAENIRTWIVQHERSQSVIMHGFVPDGELRTLMRQMTMAIIPTTELEGFGLVVLEAMALGLPVISTGQGGLSTAMGPWATPPYVFALDDVSSIAKAVAAGTELAESPAERRKLIDYAAAHDWNSVALSLVGLSRMETAAGHNA